jgi:hypothetical protein
VTFSYSTFQKGFFMKGLVAFSIALFFLSFALPALSQVAATPTPPPQLQQALQSAAQAAGAAAISAAKTSLVSSGLSLTPTLAAQIVALQAAFLGLMSLIQKLLQSLTGTAAPVTPAGAASPTAAAGSTVVAKVGFWMKIASYALTVVKIFGMNL